MEHFDHLGDLAAEDIGSLIDTARRMDIDRDWRPLAGKILGLVFMNPSLRTLASFQAGMARLGGSSFVITPGSSWALEHRDGVVMDGDTAEHVREAIPVLAGYADAIGLRAFAAGRRLDEDLAEPVMSLVKSVSPVPLINMESAMDHPCQALADWKTLDDAGVPAAGGKFVLSWARHPKPLPLAVPAAVVHMAAHRGMDVTVLRPEGFELPDAVMARARAAAAVSGGSVTETSDRQAALDGARVVYAKSWGSPLHYGDREGDARLRAGLTDWTVDEPWFGPAAPDCIFMHCLPIRRNVVAADTVLDGPRSRVLPQARNRMLVQQAVLHRLLGEE